MSDAADLLDEVAEAPAWRRRVARTIDVVAALAVLLLFVTPVIAAQGHSATGASLLEVLAWVYLGVFVVLAAAWALKKGRQREYVTIGMSIMGLRPLRMGRVTRLVQIPRAPGAARGLSGRAATAIAMPLVFAAIGFFVYELILYA